MRRVVLPLLITFIKWRTTLKKIIVFLVLTMVVCGVSPLSADTMQLQQSFVARPDTVRVAPPTGDQLKDRTSIMAAFKRARPGDTIQFAHGMYLVGKIIRVSTPRLTLIGNVKGTVLRGCTPAVYEKVAAGERKVLRSFISKMLKSHRSPTTSNEPARAAELQKQCGMFQLTGGHGVVRNLTFEYMRLGLMLGYEHQLGYRPAKGGYLVEDNTFRNNDNSIRVGLSSQIPTVIRNNIFVDTYHAVSAGGSNIQMLKNTILAPAPKRVPGTHYPSTPVAFIAIAPVKGTPQPANGRCDDNVISGNFIDGYPDGITLEARPGTGCYGNVIRDNTIVVRRVIIPKSSRLIPLPDKADSTFAGNPILISANVRDGKSGRLEDTRIEKNRIMGAEGYGIVIRHASNNRITDNTITGIILRNTVPGTAPGSTSLKTNGSAILVSPGSNGNEITGNTFHDIAGYSIVLKGDSNNVRTRREPDMVLDLGSGNHIAQPDRQ